MMGARDTGTGQRVTHDAFDGAASDGPDRRAVRNKHSSCGGARPAALDVGKDRVADLLRQRQPFGAARFTGDGEASVPPIDLVEIEVGDFACPQSEAGKQQNDGFVAQSAFARARCEDALHLRRGEKARNRRQPPAGEAGYGKFAARRAAAGRNEKAQKRASRNGDRLRTREAMRSGAFKNERPYGVRRVGLRVVAERGKKIDQGRPVGVERGLGDAAVRAHPGAEFIEYRPCLACRHRLLRSRNDPAILQMMDKECRRIRYFPVLPASLEDRSEFVKGGRDRVDREAGGVGPVRPVGEQPHQLFDGRLPVSAAAEPDLELPDVRRGHVQPSFDGSSVFRDCALAWCLLRLKGHRLCRCLGRRNDATVRAGACRRVVSSSRGRRLNQGSP
jgi:hypothetical protein